MRGIKKGAGVEEWLSLQEIADEGLLDDYIKNFSHLIYEATYSYTGVTSGDYEEGFGATGATSLVAQYEMNIKLRVAPQIIYDKNGKIVGQKWVAKMTAGSFTTIGNLAKVEPWVKVQMHVNGQKLGPEVNLSIPENSSYYYNGDIRYSYVGEATWDVPAYAVADFTYEGSWRVNGWETPRYYPPINIVPILLQGRTRAFKHVP